MFNKRNTGESERGKVLRGLRVASGRAKEGDSPSILHSFHGNRLGGYGTYFNAQGNPSV